MISGVISARESASTSSDEEVQSEIVRLLDARSARTTGYGVHFTELWKLASQCVLGGKMLRPRLLLGAFDALTAGAVPEGTSRAVAVRIAAGIELLHYSFLLHDDVIDGDLMRRGRPNLIGTIVRERDPAAFPSHGTRNEVTAGDMHWARTSGILLGDMLLAEVHQVFARVSLPEPMRSRLLDVLDHTVTESVAGEYLDVAMSDGVLSADLDTVLGMSRYKTATYTFELPLKAAAILAGATQGIEDAIGAVGKHLGVAFQLQDDLLSTFGDVTEHGKDAFSDLREGKETAIIAFARTTQAWARIEPTFGDPHLSEQDGQELRSLLVECGAERFIRSLVDEQFRTGLELLTSRASGIPTDLAAFIAQLAESMKERRS